MPLKIGFTGSQRGMTDYQRETFKELIENLGPIEFHHGDCIGADTDAHIIVRHVSVKSEITGHPPIASEKRAFCNCDYLEVLKDYLIRNHEIVKATDFMIATPQQFGEILRSGTWATIRYAKKLKKHITIIYPNGEKEVINE